MDLKDRIFGGLEKLTITSVDNGGIFTVMFNPESFTETFSTEYSTIDTVNAEEERKNYVKTNPQDFSLKLLVDGTGVTSEEPLALTLLKRNTSTVFDRVNAFLKLAWYPQPKKDTQRKMPDLLCVEWGNLKYYCRLSKVDITYTLFDKDGSPLRAELDVTFFGDAEKNKEVYAHRFSGSVKDFSLPVEVSGSGGAAGNTGGAGSSASVPGINSAGNTGTGSNGNGIVISIT